MFFKKIYKFKIFRLEIQINFSLSLPATMLKALKFIFKLNHEPLQGVMIAESRHKCQYNLK